MSEFCIKGEEADFCGGGDTRQSTADANRLKSVTVSCRGRIVVTAHPHEQVASHSGGDEP